MKNYLLLHEKALALTKQYKLIETELIDVLQLLKKQDGFRKLGFKGPFTYLTEALKLSRDQAYTFVRVAEKCEEVPELKEAISKEKLNVSTVRRILSVVNSSNQKEWIAKASSLPQRELEREVAKVNPQAVLPERSKVITGNLVENRYVATTEEEKLVSRVMDLESQRQRRNVSRQEVIKVMAEFYLEKNDPVRRARRVLGKSPINKNVFKMVARSQCQRRIPIPAQTVHQLNLRDGGRCVQCDQSRWLEVHHLVPVSQGGGNNLENLATLCGFHHRAKHK